MTDDEFQVYERVTAKLRQERDAAQFHLRSVAVSLDVRDCTHIPGQHEPISWAAHVARETLVGACRAAGLNVTSDNERSASIPGLVEAVDRIVRERDAALARVGELTEALRQVRHAPLTHALDRCYGGPCGCGIGALRDMVDVELARAGGEPPP